jgi:RNA polymerase sigma factor (sigma-70 family)
LLCCAGMKHLPLGKHLSHVEAMTGTLRSDVSSDIELAASGTEMAFARIVDAHHDDMRRVCVVICGDPTLAEEATQSAWPIAWSKLGSIRERDRLKPWLVSIAANECKQLLRKRRRRTEVEVADSGESSGPFPDPASAIDSLDLKVAMARLGPDDRALLAMRYVAGFDATELAAAIGISPAGVRSRLKRLLDHLRQELTDG